MKESKNILHFPHEFANQLRWNLAYSLHLFSGLNCILLLCQLFTIQGRDPYLCDFIKKLAMVCIQTVTVCLFVGCLTSQQQASVSQGRICSDNFTCCHTEIEVVDQTFYLTQSQYTDTGPTSPSTDPITPGARQGSHWSANV